MPDNDHDQPVIHRDLKTPNLLMASNPIKGEVVVIKITDFGLSRDKDMGTTNQVRVPLLALMIRLGLLSLLTACMLRVRRWR